MPPTLPRLPDGLRIYAIGDVHGRFDLLEDMAALISADLSTSPVDRTLEIFLGDYVDRGPQSREVVEWLAATAPLTDARCCLMGNHEAMLLNALEDPSALDLWLMNGGEATLASYGLTHLPQASAEASAACRAAIPDHHRAFLSGLPRTAEHGTYLFVHAGVDPGRPLENQAPDDLIWIREPFLQSEADFGRIVVHGHTPVPEPDIRHNRINIDTGAVFRGRLACLVIEGEAQRLMQTPPQ